MGEGGFLGEGLVENRGILVGREVLLKNRGFSGRNGGGMILMVDRGFSEKGGVFLVKKGAGNEKKGCKIG